MPPARRWIRLDVGWDEADWMVALAPGARLAWLHVLCEARIMGFGGRLKALMPGTAARLWRISERDVAAMLEAALLGGALTVADGEWKVANWSQYLPPRPSVPNRWKALRLQILERDGWTCRYCGAPADQVDHVKSRKRGGTDDPDNLVSACGFCNRSKRDLSIDEWRAGVAR